MTSKPSSVCPVERAGSLDSRLRRLLQNPHRMLLPYVQEGMSVLDFGCGPGFFTVELAQLVGMSGHVIAADLQDGMLEKVRNKVQGTELESRVQLHKCQSVQMGITRRLDFILAFYVLHELPDVAAFFSQLRPLVTVRGKMLVIEPPIHVSKARFNSMLEVAEAAGFARCV